MGGGCDKTENSAFLSTKCRVGSFVSLLFMQKWHKLVPDFVKIINGTPQLQSHICLNSKFLVCLFLYQTVLFITEIFLPCPISHILRINHTTIASAATPILMLICSLVPSRESSQKRKTQYCSPPWNYMFRSAAFDVVNYIHFFTKRPNLLRRSTVLRLPLQLVFPGPKISHG